MINIDIFYEISRYLEYNDFQRLCLTNSQIRKRLWSMLEEKVQNFKVSLPLRKAVLRAPTRNTFHRIYMLKICKFCLNRNNFLYKKIMEDELVECVEKSFLRRQQQEFYRKRIIMLAKLLVYKMSFLYESDFCSTELPGKYSEIDVDILSRLAEFFNVKYRLFKCGGTFDCYCIQCKKKHRTVEDLRKLIFEIYTDFFL